MSHVASYMATGLAGLVLLATADSLAVASARNEEWLSVHGNPANQRHVSLDQINRNNVTELGAVWVSDPFADGATSRMTPVVHEGLMFFAAGARFYALEARTGKIAWVHQTEARKPTGTPFEQMFAGLAIPRSWGVGLGGGMIFAGLMNGHLIALREKTGDVVWDKLISTGPLPVSQAITCPPLYVDGVLYLGVGSELAQGYAAAVEAKSGRVLWRVSTVAEPGQPGHETWPQHSEIWRSGGANPWAAAAADPALGLVYFVTANPGPASGGKVRPGDNLYSVSVIALQMKTGQLRWYRQLVHHDIWESDLSVPPVLLDVAIDGATRKAVAVMRGDGYLFLFDRATGAPLIPVDERPVPQNPVLFTAPTQPFPRGGESILASCESWRSKLPAGFVLGCMFEPPSHDRPDRLVQFASIRIAPMSYSTRTGYVYAQGTNSLMGLGTGDDPYVWDGTNPGVRVPNYPPPTVVLAAIDSHNGRVVWKKELPSYDDSGFKSNGGALSTGGGLVFHQGGDGTLQAFDARTGETLWRFQTDFAVGDASPMSYAIDGRQYVAFIAGSKIWAFALGGKLPQAARIPPPPREEVTGPIEDTNQIETLSLEQQPGNGHRYHLNEYAFNPYRARIRAGSSVVFINNGYLPHTIVARDGSWTTGTLGPTQVATVSFEKPGRYLYSSKEYPWSYGQIIVIPEAGASNGGSAGRQTEVVSDQVQLGKTAYAASCAACHGSNLTGRDPAPALAGRGFQARWVGRGALDLFDRIRTTMPQTAPGSLADESYAAIVAYILYSNDAPASVTLDRQTMKDLTVTTGEGR